MAAEKKTTSLMQVTNTARRGLIGCLIFIVLIIAYQNIKGFIFQTGNGVEGGLSSPYSPATKGFGDIQPLTIDSLELAPGSSPEFAIDNRFGDYPKTANVYKVLQPREKFGAVEKAEVVAEKLGFKNPFQKISEQELQWKTDTRKLTYNKVFKKWNFTVDLTKDENAIKEHRIEPDKNTYIERAQSILASLGIHSSNLANALSEAHFMRVENSRLVEVSSPASAQFVQVNIYIVREAVTPKDFIMKEGKKEENPANPLNGKVYRNNPKLGSATVILSDISNDTNGLFGFETTEWEIDQISEVYDIVDAEEAWQRIQEGKGALKSLIREGRQQLSEYEPLQVRRFITSNEKISFGYFESDTYNSARPYQTPMFIFGGRAELVDGSEAEFMFFVDALK
ncbi:hypothetical protein JW796_00715 [Candidatus Dojkabacteria bacterium]|nr:hypothetical protein [Candidatus Dojkabacteria bacterium]